MDLTDQTRTFEAVLESLEAGVPLVAASDRQARFFRQRYAALRRDAGKRVWRRPEILSWPAWLGRLTEWLDAPPQLPAGAERRLWEQTIAADPEAPVLLSVPAAATAAAEAWHRVLQWRVPAARLEAAAGPDTRHLLRWARAVERQADDLGLLLADRQPDWFADALEASSHQLLPAILLTGFEEPTPQQQRLFEQLAANGVTLQTMALPGRGARASACEFPDADTETRACAQWAAEAAAAGKRVGIVAADLADRRNALRRALRETLSPDSLFDTAPGNLPFNISLGPMLADESMVADALLLLDLLVTGRIGFAPLLRLLRSPWLGTRVASREQRLVLEAACRRRGWQEWSRNAVVRLAEQGAGAFAAELAGLPDEIDGRESRGFGGWARQFGDWLARVGWPGPRSLSSRDFQLREAFTGLLDRLAGLDLLAETVTAREALAALRRLAGEQMFQPRAAEVPVQVVGLLEATGLQFDALWVLGLDDTRWPPPARPHPLLPVDLQREYGMPHASAERELAFARHRFEALLRAASEVRVSWAAAEGDRLLRPSPLLKTIPRQEPEPVPPTYAESQFGIQALEILETDPGPPLAAGETVRGGSALLQNQAQCPFRAFALHRLEAVDWPSPEPGLDPLARGGLVHAALERFWLAVETRDRLLALTPDSRRTQVAAAVRAALNHEAPRLGLPDGVLALEAERLQALLEEWLVLEAERPAFRVAAVEARREVELAGLTLQLRLDRVDQLADGRQLIIDYKTGSPRTADWLGARPDAPQLPLYAITAESPPEGIAFAALKPGELRFAGLAGSEMGPGIEPIAEAGDESAADWPAQLAEWRHSLTALAAEFRNGHAPVEPKHSRVCEYCHLHALCRIDESRLSGLEGDEDV